MPTPTFILTIAPGRYGKVTLSVSLRQADGTQTPPREIPVDRRLAGFVAALQEIARLKLAPLKAPHARRRPSDRHRCGTRRTGPVEVATYCSK
jgi:hypothetical protein